MNVHRLYSIFSDELLEAKYPASIHNCELASIAMKIGEVAYWLGKASERRSGPMSHWERDDVARCVGYAIESWRELRETGVIKRNLRAEAERVSAEREARAS